MRLSTVFMLFFLVSGSTSSYSQNAFFSAKAYYGVNQLILNDLEQYTDLLPSKADRDDFKRAKTFIQNPTAYILSGEPAFEPQIINRLVKLRDTYKVEIVNGRREYKPQTTYSSPAQYSTNTYLERATPFSELASGLAEVLFGGPLSGGFQTRLADGTATLLLERAEREMLTSFFDRLRSEMDTKPHVLSYSLRGETWQKTIYLKELFPAVYRLLTDQQQLFSYNLGHSMQQAFTEDVHSFYDHADRYLVPDPLKERAPYMLFKLSFETIMGLGKGEHPSVVLSQLVQNNPLQQLPETPKAGADSIRLGLHLMAAFSEELMDVSPDRIWVRSDQIKTLTAREWEFFMAFTVLKHRPLFKGLGLDPMQTASPASWLKLRRWLEAIGLLLESIENKSISMHVQNANVKGRPAMNATQDTYASFQGSEQPRERSMYELANQMLDLLLYIRYFYCDNPAQGNSLLCSETFNLENIQIARDILQIPLLLEEKDYGKAVAKSIVVVEQINRNNASFQWPNGLIRTISLAADIAAADSTVQIKEALDNVILPPQSYRIKRQGVNSITINSFVGASGGLEYLDNNRLAQPAAGHISAFAPIGIDVSWGRGSSNGVFVSLFDVGALVSYRLQQTGYDTLVYNALPDIKWKQLISPGVFYTHGLKNSPLAMGAGVHLNPSLRSIRSEDGVLQENSNAVRFSAFVSVDLPLFTIHSTQKAAPLNINEGMPYAASTPLHNQAQITSLEQDIRVLTTRLLQTEDAKTRKSIQSLIESKEKQLKKLRK